MPFVPRGIRERESEGAQIMTFPGAAEVMAVLVADVRECVDHGLAAATVLDRYDAIEREFRIHEMGRSVERINVVLAQVKQAVEKRDWKRASAVAMAFGISIGATQVEAAKPAMVQLSTMAKDLQPGSFCEPIAETFCQHLATMAKDLVDETCRLASKS